VVSKDLEGSGHS